MNCEGFHIFDMELDATCDGCGLTREELGVDMAEYKRDWEAKLLALKTDSEILR